MDSRDCGSQSFASRVLFIHTGLWPGGKAFTVSRNRFNGLHGKCAGKPLKRFSGYLHSFCTGLKPGVNESTLRQAFTNERDRSLTSLCDASITCRYRASCAAFSR